MTCYRLMLHSSSFNEITGYISGVEVTTGSESKSRQTQRRTTRLKLPTVAYSLVNSILHRQHGFPAALRYEYVLVHPLSTFKVLYKLRIE